MVISHMKTVSINRGLEYSNDYSPLTRELLPEVVT